MKGVLKFFFRYFISILIIYPPINFVLKWIFGDSFKWGSFLFEVIGFSIFFSLFMTIFHTYAIGEVKPGPLTDEDYNRQQKFTLKSHLSPVEIIQKLRTDDRFKTAQIQHEGNTINMETSVSWRSWGTKINVTINREEGEYEYTFTSYPKYKFQVTDNGESLDHIQRIRQALGHKNISHTVS